MRVVFVGRDRVLWKVLLLNVVTLGVYRHVWLYRVGKEVDGHEALGTRHALRAALLCLPVLGPLVVTFPVANATGPMVRRADLRYGPGWLLGLTSLVPVLGTGFFLLWTQGRLNRLWAHARAHPETGVELDVGLENDPAFLVEVGRALKESYRPGSRFDARSRARKARWAARSARFQEVQQEREAVRAAGGSTPLLPWRRPKRPEVRLLKVTCGRCQAAFQVERDPAAETPLVCPGCGMTEVLPALHQEPLAKPEPAAVAAVQAKCPDCGTRFHAVRNLHGPTELKCPSCGRADSLPLHAKAERPRKRAAKA